METLDFDFAGNTNQTMHDMYLFDSGHPSGARSGGDDDDDKDDEDDDARDSENDENPAIDQKVVHSSLPTDNGGKPKS